VARRSHKRNGLLNICRSKNLTRQGLADSDGKFIPKTPAKVGRVLSNPTYPRSMKPRADGGKSRSPTPPLAVGPWDSTKLRPPIWGMAHEKKIWFVPRSSRSIGSTRQRGSVCVARMVAVRGGSARAMARHVQ